MITPSRAPRPLRDVAAVVDVLLSDAASFVSGCDLLMEGAVCEAVPGTGAMF
jgi:hypothetical protein